MTDTTALDTPGVDELVTLDVDELDGDIAATLATAARMTGVTRDYASTVTSGICERVGQLLDGATGAVVVTATDIPGDTTWALHVAADLIEHTGDTSGARDLRALADMCDTGTAAPDWAPTRGGVADRPSGLS